MTIENTLERIAVALEKIAEKSPSITRANFTPEAKQETQTSVVDEQPKKKAVKAAPVAEPREEADPFQADEPAKQYTQADVRAALQAYAKVASQATALALMAKHGGGAQTIAQVKPELYAAVVSAIPSVVK